MLFLEQVEFLTGRYNSHLKYNLVSFKKLRSLLLRIIRPDSSPCRSVKGLTLGANRYNCQGLRSFYLDPFPHFCILYKYAESWRIGSSFLVVTMSSWDKVLYCNEHVALFEYLTFLVDKCMNYTDSCWHFTNCGQMEYWYSLFIEWISRYDISSKVTKSLTGDYAAIKLGYHGM